jgi:F-type H+-transporting ATPase subunit delta
LITSKVSKRYAKALLSLGKEDGKFQQYGQELGDFSSFFQQTPDFREAISNPVFTLEDRRKVLSAVLARSHYSQTVKNFLHLLLEKKRIGAVPAIDAHYNKLTDEVANIARAEVITPMPLNENARERLERALEGLTSRKVKMEAREDKALIGGIVVKIGDLVLDGSIKTQLKGLKESLKRGEYI